MATPKPHTPTAGATHKAADGGLTPESLRRALSILATMAEAYERRDGRQTHADKQDVKALRRVVTLLESSEARRGDEREKLARVHLFHVFAEVYESVVNPWGVWNPATRSMGPGTPATEAQQHEAFRLAFDRYRRMCGPTRDPGAAQDRHLDRLVRSPDALRGSSRDSGPKPEAARAVERLLDGANGSTGRTTYDRARKLTRWGPQESFPAAGDEGNYFGAVVSREAVVRFVIAALRGTADDADCLVSRLRVKDQDPG